MYRYYLFICVPCLYTFWVSLVGCGVVGTISLYFTSRRHHQRQQIHRQRQYCQDVAHGKKERPVPAPHYTVSVFACKKNHKSLGSVVVSLWDDRDRIHALQAP